MLNWQESNEYKRIKKYLKSTDEIDMPVMSTQAFKVKRDGVVYKVRLLENSADWEAIECARELLEKNFDIPDICNVEKCSDNKSLAFVEWIEGETAREYREIKGRLPEEFYYNLGLYAAKMHNLIFDGRYISVLAWWPRNFIITKDLKVILIDINKLYYTDFPECFLIKGIIAETPSVDKSQANAFLKGYRELRPFNISTILSKYYSLFDFPKEVLQIPVDLPHDMSGMYVVEIDYKRGELPLECALRGAKRVFAYGSQYVNIGRCHHRMSDIGKLLSVSHGFTEESLLYKHHDTTTDWFKYDHFKENLKYIPRGRYDIVFAPRQRKEELEPILKPIADRIYWR